ncbi:hypothetical protein [Streptomyces sp. NPDC048641]|uniref:hypothetical protein n=1 Tax=Streptomyces sp. NPDC048641 TaxID=3154825 RepID=UPI0034374B57
MAVERVLGPDLDRRRFLRFAVRVPGAGPTGGFEAQVRDVEGPDVGGVAQVEAEDGDAVVARREVGAVAGLEGGVLCVAWRGAGDERVHLGDQFGLGAALLDQRARHERGALGEEVQDVQARPLGDRVEEVGGVGGEVGRGGRLAQGAGQPAVTEADRLDVVHVQVAEGEEPAGEGSRDRLLLVRGERGLARGLHGFPHQTAGEVPDLLLPEGPLLAAEGDEAREAYGLVHQARTGAVAGEELLHQRREDA